MVYCFLKCTAEFDLLLGSDHFGERNLLSCDANIKPTFSTVSHELLGQQWIVA